MLMKKKKIKNDLSLLKLLAEDQSKQNYLYKPTSYWKSNSFRTENNIRRLGIEEFRSVPAISKGFSDVITYDPLEIFSGSHIKEKFILKLNKTSFIRKYCTRYYLKKINNLINENLKLKSELFENNYGNWLKEFLFKKKEIEMNYGKPSDKLMVNGKYYPKTYLTAFKRIDLMSKLIDLKKIKCIFEIGGGFGSFAHSILSFYNNICKLYYLDIVPNIYLGTQYLDLLFPRIVKNYKFTKNQNLLLSKEKKVIFAIPPWELKKIQNDFDLFVNFASFQEIEKKVLINYLELIKKRSKNKTLFCFGFYKTDKNNRLNSDEVLCLVRSFFGNEINAVGNNFLGSEEEIYLFKNN